MQQHLDADVPPLVGGQGLERFAFAGGQVAPADVKDVEEDEADMDPTR